jgi:hypothetical protein
LNENLVDKSHKCECWKNNLNHKIPRNEIKSCFDANNQFKIEGSGLTGDEYLNKIKSILN